MKLPIRLAVALLVILAAADAGAEPVRHLDRIPVDPAMMKTTPRDRLGDISSHTIYLNRCTGGCSIGVGSESAMNNTSSIFGQAIQISEFKYSDDEWDQLVQCVKETYADFNVKIVTERPTSGSYWMSVAAGTSDDAGIGGQGILGVSPWLQQCPEPVYNETITYTFINDQFMDHDVNEWCWVVAQETAHSFGLDHEALAGDPMTYIGLGQLPTPRHDFADQDAPCGAFSANDDGCSCLGTTQNSYQQLLEIFGPSCLVDEDCGDAGEGFVCAGGSCLPGPGVEGGLGTTCENSEECLSGHCTQSSNEGNYCTESCAPGGTDCPAGFDCLENGSSGVCWPQNSGGGGCCSAAGETPTGPIALGFLAGLLLIRRRRAR
jgi:uncharacterized protein (TIGR03382 family)